MQWQAYIDNLVAYRDGNLILDIERHTAQNLEGQNAQPHFAFMIDQMRATEGNFLKKPLSPITFKEAIEELNGYKLEKETALTIKFTNKEKNIFFNWENNVSYKGESAGNMIGLIQIELLPILEETLSLLERAAADWNKVALKLRLKQVDASLLQSLCQRAIEENAKFPEAKATIKWPEKPVRFHFEQE